MSSRDLRNAQPDYVQKNASEFPSHRDMIAFLQKYPRVIGGIESKIFDVKFARGRKRPTVTFKEQWSDGAGGCSWSMPQTIEDSLWNGRFLFDQVRGLWVNPERLTDFVRRFGKARKAPSTSQVSLKSKQMRKAF